MQKCARDAVPFARSFLSRLVVETKSGFAEAHTPTSCSCGQSVFDQRLHMDFYFGLLLFLKKIFKDICSARDKQLEVTGIQNFILHAKVSVSA